jgi:hypothetical protein
MEPQMSAGLLVLFETADERRSTPIGQSPGQGRGGGRYRIAMHCNTIGMPRGEQFGAASTYPDGASI